MRVETGTSGRTKNPLGKGATSPLAENHVVGIHSSFFIYEIYIDANKYINVLGL